MGNIMDERIRKFENLNYNKEEQEQLSSLFDAEALALKERKRQARDFAFNSAKALMFGSPLSAYNAAKSAYQNGVANGEINRINNERDAICEKIRSRYDDAINYKATDVSERQNGNYCR